jgi:hypothetical protein
VRRFLVALGMPLLVSSAVAAGAEVAGPKAAAQPVGPQQVILDANDFWRCHLTWRTEMVKTEKGEVLPVIIGTWPGKFGRLKVLGTPPPPVEWMAPDFDDSSWEWIQGTTLMGRSPGNRQLSSMCLRAKFSVSDPSSVRGLTLNLAYRGGAVVYLNGKEIARDHMPEGVIAPETPALDYPREAYLNEKGHLGQEKECPARVRRMEPVAIPSSALVKGLNVLALDLHRSLTDEVLQAKLRYGSASWWENGYWPSLALQELKLTASPGSGATPARSAPAKLRAWAQNAAARVSTGEYGDAFAKSERVRIVGCRNGTFSGLLVAGAAAPLKGIKAVAAPIRQGADAAIPAENVRVRYGAPARGTSICRHFPYWSQGADWFEGLEEEAPAEVPLDGARATMPVWVTIRIPKDAKPGLYRGAITVSAQGEEAVELPLELSVADWRLPDPQELTGYVGLIQSPESVAMRYGAELWSEEHWKLLDKAFALLGEIGNKEIYITAVCKTYFGNEHGMIRWIKKDGGGYDVDFSIAERYLDTALKHLGKPPVICLYAWDSFKNVLIDDMSPPNLRDTGPKTGVAFTVKDPKTGQLEYGTAPMWGTPESAAFWKPVLEGLQQRLEKRGLAGSLMIGISHDFRPRANEAVADFEKACPGIRWVSQSHREPPGYMKTGLAAVVYTAGRFNDPGVERKYGWRSAGTMHTAFTRDDMKTELPGMFFSVVETRLVAGDRGFSRAGADFWTVLKDAKGRWSGDLLHRYANIFFMNVVLTDSTPALLAPGKNGPISTLRFETLREGLQEAEARVFMEKALLDPATKGRLGPELAERCQQFLDDRVRLMGFTCYGGECSPSSFEPQLFPYCGWQGEAAKLYALAGEIARKLEGK